MMQTHPQVQIASIKGFLEFGMIDHILLSQNVNHVTLMTVNGGDGYAHLLKNIIPLLKSYSITDEQLHTMMVENPARLLAFPTA
jgi:phosphotriesterase-related protein